jgi:hypothetical protein
MQRCARQPVAGGGALRAECSGDRDDDQSSLQNYALLAGSTHPEPQFVLSITIRGSCMYALCFTESGGARGRAARSSPDVEGAEVAFEEAAGVPAAAVAREQHVGARLEELSVCSTSGDESSMEVFQLDLHTFEWSKVDAKVVLSPQRPALSRRPAHRCPS